MSSSLLIYSVSKSFQNGDSAVLRDFNLSLLPGEIISLVGPSGCGKSTLLRLVAGLDQADSGQIEVNGQALHGPDRQVGLMFQEPRLFPWLDVSRNIAFGLPRTSPKTSAPAAIKQLLEQVGLENAARLLPRQLSGGMAQRVALARALAGDPGLLLLDEPFSAVDAFTRMRLQELLLQVWQLRQPTLLLVTHDVDEALYLSDRVVVLTEKPASVHHVIEVKIARAERARTHPELLRLRATLLRELQLAGEAA